MHETYDHNDEAWHDNDFMTLFGLNAAAQGTALISYPASGSNPPSGSIDMHVHYLGPNQHVYDEYHKNSTGWFSQDVNTAAQLDVPDSGTVSLTVGAFTATACFGPSTNPACSGLPVNNGPNDVASALTQALNASGSPVTATASGATITMTWKASGAATPVSPLSTAHDNPNLFSSPSFTSGAASFGGGTGGTLPVFNITYNFNLGNGDNGNVIGITNNRDTTRSQNFTYDYLNRLTSAQNAGTNCNQMTVNGKTEYWGNSYGYDPWGNLLGKTPTKCSAENLSVSVLTNNQLVGYGYDAAGNMTHDATTNVNYTFDADNRITGAAGYTYTYDADGNRVEKSNGSTGTIYWYMTPGIVAESDLSGNLKSEYVFFDGDRIARRDFPSNAVSYYFSDHLKTASVITDPAANIKADSDFYPWGGELQFVNSDSNHYKFTGKERDTETGLDYFGARYYGNWYGRFLSADWSEKPEAVPYADRHDPQSLNLYSYVRNIPTSKTDANGHYVVPSPLLQKTRRPTLEDLERDKEEDEAFERAREKSENNERTEQANKDFEAAQKRARENPNGYDDPDGVCHVGPPPSGSTIGPAGPPSENLPTYTPGGKTSGLFYTPGAGEPVPLLSGVAGPAQAIPKGTPGFDAYVRTHVEGHAAAIMRDLGLKEATVRINNPTICGACMRNLSNALPPGSRLTVVLPSGHSQVFVGNAR